MRTLSKTIVALGLVALMAGPALAQQGRGGRGGRGFGGGGGIGMLLSNASVQQELKLDATQIEKAKELSTKLREKVTAATQGLEGQERFAKMREMSKELNTEANTAAKEFLKPRADETASPDSPPGPGPAGFHRRARPEQAQADRRPEE